MTEKTRLLLPATLIFICLASCGLQPQPLPDWPTPAPPPTPLPVTIPGWEGVILHSICLKIDQFYTINGEPYVLDSQHDDPLHIREFSEAFLADIGIQISPDSSSCEGIVRLSVEGETLSAAYSGLGGCHTGDKVDVRLTLTADNLVTVSDEYTEIFDPPDAITACNPPRKPDTFRGVIRKPLFLALVYPWGPDAYGSGLVNIFPQPEIVAEELVIAIPFLIQSLNDTNEAVQKYALKALEHIGPPAVDAAPYVIRCWEEDTCQGAPVATLRNIAGISYPSGVNEWKEWWRDNLDKSQDQ